MEIKEAIRILSSVLKYADKVYRKALILAIAALEKLEAIKNNEPPTSDWEVYSNRLYEQAYEREYRDGKEDAENDRWIPVTERPPKIGKYVLCQLSHSPSEGGGKIQVCKYCAPDKYRDKPYFDHFRNGFPNVLAWRPLPEPYQEDKA